MGEIYVYKYRGLGDVGVVIGSVGDINVAGDGDYIFNTGKPFVVDSNCFCGFAKDV